jgi:peptide/nickel transport system ATP-binding protein
MSSALLELQGLDVRFGETHAVRSLDLRIETGETVALVGESGCGKSTIALAIMGLLPGAATVGGKILLDGRELLSLRASQVRELRGSSVSMIFQEPMTSLNPVMTVGAQIMEALRRHRRLSARAARERAIELLDLVHIPHPRARVDEYPHRLSGGQRQRVMIAIAVACEPRLLIADEPTTALDVTIQARMLELLDDLRTRMKMSLLFITHDLDVVGQYADRVAVMYDGVKVEEGVAAEVFRSPGHPYTRGLLSASLLDGDYHYQKGPLAEVRAERNPNTGTVTFSLSRERRGEPAGESLQRLRPQETPVELRAPLLRVADLRSYYTVNRQTVRAVDGVSFEIARGETLGLVGESGCGKSTLSRTLLGLVPPTAGVVEIDGQKTSHLDEKSWRTLRRKAQMVFQDPFASLNPRHTVRTILDTALRVHGFPDADERDERIRDILRRVDLPLNSLRRFPHEFSGGQRQRIGIARALVLRPALIICDEPVSALDVSVRAQVLNLLVEIKRDLGLSYLFISHDLAVVRYMADRVLVMHRGKIVEQGDPRAIWANPEHEYTRTLIEAVPKPRAPLAVIPAADFAASPA